MFPIVDSSWGASFVKDDDSNWEANEIGNGLKLGIGSEKKEMYELLKGNFSFL